MSAPEWLTEQEASQKTSIPVETLRTWRKAKKNIPFSKIGRLVRYNAQTVTDYMESCAVAVTEVAA